jgi:hypothetical protein
LLIAGDTPHPQGPLTLEDLIEGRSDYYIAFISPSLTMAIHNELRQFDEGLITDELQEVLARERGDWEELCQAYADVAERGNALMIVIA